MNIRISIIISGVIYYLSRLGSVLLFNPERASRLVIHKARDAQNQPGLKEVMNKIIIMGKIF